MNKKKTQNSLKPQIFPFFSEALCMHITKATCEKAIIYKQSYTKKMGWGFIVYTYKYEIVSSLSLDNISPREIIVIANATLY